jgi:polar amino acid transport system substrate-binding protein
MRRFLLALAAFLCVSAAAHAETTYERVIRTGTIRCGYYTWEPMLAKDINSGQMRGGLVEIMEEIGKRLSLKIEWTEEAPMTTYIEGTQSGRYDMGCGPLYVLGSRARLVHFVTPMLYSPMQMAVRADDHRFDSGNLSAFDSASLTLAVQEGEAGAIVTRQKFPSAKLDAIPPMSEYSQLFQEVMTGKADAAVIAPSAFYEFEKTNPGKLRMLPEAVTNNEIAYGVSNNDFAFASMIDGAVREVVNDGTVAEIMRRHDMLKSMPVPVPSVRQE